MLSLASTFIISMTDDHLKLSAFSLARQSVTKSMVSPAFTSTSSICVIALALCTVHWPSTPIRLEMIRPCTPSPLVEAWLNVP